MKVFLISLGCDKNLCDSEVMLGLLCQKGYSVTDDETEADVIIVNSCSFIGDAQKESIEAIIDAGKYKKTGACKLLIVTGCLSQRFAAEIKEQMPEVDGILGTASFDKICELIDELSKKNGANNQILEDINSPVHGNYPRLLSTGGHYAYLKIAEGCNKRCSYCIIPSLRGKFRSVPIEDLIEEAKSLAISGVKELILVAQETTLYGLDLYGSKSLHILISKLSEIEGLEWIRVLYCYPEEIYEELIREFETNRKLVKYLDLPIQSGCDAVLKAMGRLTSKSEIENLVGELRRRVPGIALRTTLISGFPGETDENHVETLDLVKKLKFDRLGVFTYSKEDGTRAAKMKPQVPARFKRKRRNEIMELQQGISKEISCSLIGREMAAFVEGKVADENVYVARTYRDAPDVDGYVFINSGRELMSGDLVKVKITDSSEYDLIGDIINECT